MNVSRIKNIEQVRSFFSGTLEIQFVIADGAARERDKTRYDVIAEVVRRFAYRQRARGDKSLILRYLQRLTGYSAVQVRRLVRQVATDATSRNVSHRSSMSFANNTSTPM